jgi:hypothetical protein
VGLVFGRNFGAPYGGRRRRSSYRSGRNLFWPNFTSAYVQAGISKATGDVDRARLRGMETWPEVQPAHVQGRLLVYTGTNDGNVVKQLELQRGTIEAAGGELRVLGDCNHLELISETGKVARIVEPFLRRMF